jgi:hypothetical protein
MREGLLESTASAQTQKGAISINPTHATMRKISFAKPGVGGMSAAPNYEQKK